MGILNLNKITKNVKVYNIKANTAIIDGNNLIYIYLYSSSNCLRDPQVFRNYDVNIIDVGIEQQIYSIVEQALLSLIKYTYYLYGKLTNERNIIFVFDPYKEPKYIINHKIFKEEIFKEDIIELDEEEIIKLINKENQEHVYEMKKDERKKRFNQKNIDVNNIINNELNKLVEINNSNINNKTLELCEITQLLNISDINEIKDNNIFQNPKILNKLSSFIIKEFLYICNKSNFTDFEFTKHNILNHISDNVSSHIHFIQAISEADLVITDLAGIFNYDKVVVCSRDTDYFILLSDIPNVYKTDIFIRDYYLVTELWKQIDDNITYDDIIAIATLSGSDYTNKDKIMGFDIEEYRKLLNHQEVKGIKIKQYLNNYKKISDIIQYLPEKFKRTYELYKNKYYNNKFEIYTPYNINIINYINKYLINKIVNENLFKEMSKENAKPINNYNENIKSNNIYNESTELDKNNDLIFEEPEINID